VIKVEATIVNLDGVRDDLARLMDQLGDKAVDQFLRRAGALARASLRKTFAKGGRPPWAPLAATTLERRRYPAAKRQKSSSHSHLFARAAEEMDRRLAKSKVKKISYKARAALIDKATMPLGGAQGTFAKSVRVKRLRGQQVYIGPPWSYKARHSIDLYSLWVLHAQGSGRLPARRMDYLQPGDEDKIVKIAEDIIDKALKIKPQTARGGRVTNLLYGEVRT